MIPKIIHSIWLGERELPEEYRAYMEGRKKLLPGWEFRLWNEKNFDFSANPYAREAYRAKKYGFVADYIRVCVLAEYGGVYLDTDVELLRPFPDDLLGADYFQGFENDAYVETAVIGCVPEHPIMRRLVSFYGALSFTDKKGKPNLVPNPLYFTYFLAERGLRLKNGRQTLGTDGRMVICAREVFSPIDFTTGKDMRTAETVAVHHFANSWSGKKQQAQQVFLRGVRKIFGRRIFACFTRGYVRSVFKKINRLIGEP